MDAIQTELFNILFNLLLALIIPCVGLITKHIMSYLKHKGALTKLENNRQIVKVVVQAIEQTYKGIDGNAKLRIAKKEIVQLMKSKNINISENEINLLIESVIKEIKDVIKNNK